MPKPISTRSWNTLNPREQLARGRALEVLSHARRSRQSLSRLSREYKISTKAVLRATQGFEKIKGRWKAKKIDHISHIMTINENGKEAIQAYLEALKKHGDPVPVEMVQVSV